MKLVVIVGGGFGGLAAARALEGAAVQVVLVDRVNHHLFQPLLYQVATAALSPAEIAWPLRRCFEDSRTSGLRWGRSPRSIERRVASCSPRLRRFPMTD